MKGSGRSWVRITGINVALTLLLLAAIEAGVRLTHPEITQLGTDSTLVQDSVYGAVPGLRPGASGTSNGARFTVDADGFWAYETATDTASTAWLLLGDSVTMGIGVPPESTFVGRLAAAVDTTRLLNPSLIGYGVHHYAQLLEIFTEPSSAHHRPDLRRVTLFWCLNDVFAGLPVAPAPGGQLVRAAEPLLGWLRRHVYTYQWLKALLFDRPRTYFEHDRRFYTPASTHWQATRAALERIAQACAAQNLRCDLVLLPYAYQLRPEVPADVFTPQAMLREALAGTPLHLYDPAPQMAAAADTADDWFLYGDGIHFSQAGHAWLAAYLRAEVVP